MKLLSNLNWTPDFRRVSFPSPSSKPASSELLMILTTSLWTSPTQFPSSRNSVTCASLNHSCRRKPTRSYTPTVAENDSSARETVEKSKPRSNFNRPRLMLRYVVTVKKLMNYNYILIPRTNPESGLCTERSWCYSSFKFKGGFNGFFVHIKD